MTVATDGWRRTWRLPIFRRLVPILTAGVSSGAQPDTEAPLTTYLARGLYSIPAAARLIGEKPGRLRRWAFGYERNGRWYDPAINADLDELGGEQVLTFLDLVELLFIHGLRQSGQSFSRIHEAHRVLSILLETEHPFALKRGFSDPAGIYALLEREDQGDLLVELKGAGQIAMWPALHRYLRQLEFNLDDVAERWYPAGRASPIVVDPRISFGAPVIEGTRIETAMIADLYQGEDSIEEIAWLYDLEPVQINAAVEFEASLVA